MPCVRVALSGVRVHPCAGKRISAAHPPCKSELMLLCERFQARFGGDPSVGGNPGAQGGPPALILLNEAALELAVPRRRLYDIINVLEAVEVGPWQLGGSCCVLWVGRTALVALLCSPFTEAAGGGAWRRLLPACNGFGTAVSA